MTFAISRVRYRHVSAAALLASVLLAACGSENDEATQVSAADVVSCDRYDPALPDDNDCAGGKRAFDCPENVDLAGKCDFAGEWATGGSNEPTRSGKTWCCAL
jgi:hypothetical protein